MFTRLRNIALVARNELLLPAPAKRARRRDRRGLAAEDPGVDRVIAEAVAWLGRAQDRSASGDGGVARDYSLIKGWATSYPETTGYIVPTMIDYAAQTGDRSARERARRMLDWLVAIQLAEGGFQGGRIDSRPVVPVTFNTGQILLGLAAGVAAFGDYRQPMRRAADWLVATQDADGCWRKFATPFAAAGEKAYETHVAWGLIEAARQEPASGYGEAALANVRWALTNQRENGFFEQCCLNDPSRPLTHTLGYVLRGVIEAFRFSEDPALLGAARRTADGLLRALGDDGHLAGRLLPDWRPAVDWVCLTGSVQVAHCWLLLFRLVGDERYRDAGFLANRYVRRTISMDGPDETRGAVRGSFPVDGEYGRFVYLNWAAKFCVDSQMLENEIRAEQRYRRPAGRPNGELPVVEAAQRAVQGSFPVDGKYGTHENLNRLESFGSMETSSRNGYVQHPGVSVEFQAMAAPTRTHSDELAALYPQNPFCTPAFADAYQSTGVELWLFSVTESDKLATGSIGFLSRGRLSRVLEIRSLKV